MRARSFSFSLAQTARCRRRKLRLLARSNNNEPKRRRDMRKSHVLSSSSSHPLEQSNARPRLVQSFAGGGDGRSSRKLSEFSRRGDAGGLQSHNPLWHSRADCIMSCGGSGDCDGGWWLVSAGGVSAGTWQMTERGECSFAFFPVV